MFVNPRNDLVRSVNSRRRVHTFDATLRDGEQTVDVALGTADEVAIARVPDDLGVDSIERARIT